MSKPKAPKAPDPYQTAAADFSYNNFNQRTPYGNVDITAPQFDRNNHLLNPGTITMTPTEDLNRQLGLQNALTEGALNQAYRRQTYLDSSLPGLPSSLDFSRVRQTPGFTAPQLQSLSSDFSGDRQRVEQANFARARGLLDPVFAEQERSLRGTLADQGLPAGGEARNYELGNFYDQRNQAYNQAAQDAVLSGGQEQSRMFDMANNQRLTDFNGALQGQQAQFNAGMQGRQSDIADQLQNFNILSQNRGTQFNELQALLGQQQVAQPSLQNFYSPQGSNFLGAQQLQSNAQGNNYAVGSQNSSNLFGGMLGALGTLGGAAILMSDKRTKTDIEKFGKTAEGHNIYKFRYKGSPLMQLGVMAQEIEKKDPDAVLELDGIKFVDYAKVH